MKTYMRKDIDFLKNVPIKYKKCEKVIKLYKNSEKLCRDIYRDFEKNFHQGRHIYIQRMFDN